MRIALDCTSSAVPLGHGVKVYVQEVVSALAEIARSEDRFDICYETHKWHSRHKGVGEIDGRFRRRRLWPTLAQSAWTADVDVFHALDSRLAGPKLAPEIVTFHDMYPFDDSLWMQSSASAQEYRAKRLERYASVARRADAVICVSQSTRSRLLGVVPDVESGVTVIYHGVDQSIPEKTPDESHVLPSTLSAVRRPYFLHLGSMWQVRNLERTVQAFSLFAAGVPGVDLLAVGKEDTSLEPAMRIAAREGLADRFKVLGVVPEADKLFLLSRAEALLYFHLDAGFGLPVLEAMICGAPVLAGRRGALPEVAGDAALYADPDDADAMAAAMYRIMTDKAEKERLVGIGRQRARIFTWEKTARETYELYGKVLAALA
ncbi:MAG: glycosyltransferase family 4 protein [Planctomycetes bacterium]|nr:glycosyltransferase family 4 protein [Planctomycetota bacterium]